MYINMHLSLHNNVVKMLGEIMSLQKLTADITTSDGRLICQ
jgi:hypothetical protein